jgi:hypothetical protein
VVDPPPNEGSIVYFVADSELWHWAFVDTFIDREDSKPAEEGSRGQSEAGSG